jgi:hypothetical protein
LIFAGCGGGSQVKVVVRAAKEANGRRPFYVLVRSVDDKTYLEESYQAVAGKVMARDASVLEAVMVFPGTPKTIEVDKPEKGSLGVYFLLTRPGGQWKTLVASPVPGKLEFSVEGDRMQKVD